MTVSDKLNCSICMGIAIGGARVLHPQKFSLSANLQYIKSTSPCGITDEI